ncbi:hypothetical protein [Corynebacterium renale]|uniref:hypothetical protein n=1 Tax=Corynebacterium renale TaxID=1724 RepID=UPI000A999CCD|nr:hypothetical protein [Corynebacterium renale]
MKAVLAFTAINLKRVVKDWPNLVFSVLLPVVLYLIFGAAQDYGGQSFAGGNVTAFVMVGMALYAGITAAVSAASSAVVENHSGWGRQLALTPMRPAQIIAAQALIIVARAVLSIGAVYLAGALTGASMPAQNWAATFALAVVACLPSVFTAWRGCCWCPMKIRSPWRRPLWSSCVCRKPVHALAPRLARRWAADPGVRCGSAGQVPGLGGVPSASRRPLRGTRPPLVRRGQLPGVGVLVRGGVCGVKPA